VPLSPRSAKNQGVGTSTPTPQNPEEMNLCFKKHLKQTIKIIVDGNGNPVTIVFHLTNGQLYKILDVLLPDEIEEDVVGIKFDLRTEK
jgi:hypothetical protein